LLRESDNRKSVRSFEDPLDDRPWLRVVTALVDLFDELERIGTAMPASERAVPEHTQLRLQEILERSGVTLIANDAMFDRSRHQPEPPGTSVARGAAITTTLSPGFVVGRRVLRRARVQVDDKVEDQSLPTKGQTL